MPLKTPLVSLCVAAGLLLAAGGVLAERQAATVEPASVPADASVPATAPPVPLLWRASRGDTSVYLLGTFHLLRPSDYPLAPEVDAAFDAAQRVVFELPPEELASPALGFRMAQAGMRTDGTQLASELPPETAQALEAWLTANAATLQPMGLNAQAVQMFEPWFVALTVTLVEMTAHGLDPSLGLDAHLSKRAGEAGKATQGLETGDQQIAFLAGMHRPEQLQFLREALDTTGEAGAQELDKLHDAWRTGDERLLWNEMAVRMRMEYPALYHRINVARNDAWLPKIEGLFEQPGDSLVAVGALHLLGEDGVVHKLQQRGFEVERVTAVEPSTP